ncbi:MAG: ScyD/ScyE family protein, partial [Chloroflexi bacterium]|nr:ScyD/ScyE family protein [Chloroflexota bacterium]
GEYFNGFTGRISKIDPVTGTRTTVVDGLPSQAGPEGDSVGPADVDFLGGKLYYVQTHGGEGYGFPDNPTGIYRVDADGSIHLIADIGQFNLDNPIADVTSGAQLDIEIGGNPYSMIVRDGAFLVVDGNQNQVIRVTADGDISRLAEFSGHPVSTGIASQAGGPLYVGGLGQFPFTAEDGNVYRIGFPTGNITEIADGFSSVTDVEFGPGGQLYALTFGDQAADPSMIPWDVFSGKILKVNGDGTMSPVVDGLNLTTSLIFVGDTAYVSNNGVSIPGVFDGEIVKIENFSSLEPQAPPAPAPTTAPPAPAPTRPTGVITAPDTGTGTGTAGDDNSSLLWLVLLVGAAGIACTGAAAAVTRR